MILRSLSPILSVVVAVVLAVFFIKPTYDETLLIQKDIDSYRDAKMKYEEFTSNLQIKINGIRESAHLIKRQINRKRNSFQR